MYDLVQLDVQSCILISQVLSEVLLVDTVLISDKRLIIRENSHLLYCLISPEV